MSLAFFALAFVFIFMAIYEKMVINFDNVAMLCIFTVPFLMAGTFFIVLAVKESIENN